ncbi:MAG TPA: DUF3291 domain-containing protein [Bryobacteraceae bacterium]|jgi:hypothetical protein|nr:DUF3291 domain-containing protein [Bryobacteraceae bacterium]
MSPGGGTHHLAQINVARLVAPIDDPRIADFVAQLDAINALAEPSEGFVWRLQSEEGNATESPYRDDPFVIVNMSVWNSVEALKAFTYKSGHLAALRDRSKWFEKMDSPHYCLWWIPAGQIPSVAQAAERLAHYQRYGASPYSFWFNQLYPAEEFVTR